LHADRDRLARVEQTLEAQRERIQQQHLQLEESIKHTFDMRLQSERERVQQQHLQLEESMIALPGLRDREFLEGEPSGSREGLRRSVTSALGHQRTFQTLIRHVRFSAEIIPCDAII
jgi:hypothetical protein